VSSAATSDVVDASLWVSQLVPGDAHHRAARRWLDAALAAGGWTPVVPALALPEVAGAVARRTGVPALGEEALAALRAVPGLRVVALDISLGEEAGRVAARLGLRGADAVYVAVAHALGVPLVTLDDELEARAGRFIRVERP
jgi:predicted nucleic acid-binding protein